MDGIDATFIINMDSATKRMDHMAHQCEERGIPFMRVSAIDGSKVKRHVLDEVATPFCKRTCTNSMIGCALSHMRVWKAVLQGGYDRVLVMEDDADLVPDFKERLQQALHDVPADFDVLLCGCFFLCNKERSYAAGHHVIKHLMPYKRRTDRRTWGSVFVPEFFGGSHCYVVSNKGCRSLFRAISKVGTHIDIAMNHPDLRLYAVSPDLAFQRDMTDSSIASYAFPKSLVPMLDTITDDKNISMAYYLDAPTMQIGGHVLNGWAVVFLLLGLLGRWTAPYVAGMLLAELILGGRILVPTTSFLLGWALSYGAARVYTRFH